MKLLEDSQSVRRRYQELLASAGNANVYHSSEWLDVFVELEWQVSFVDAGDTLIPFVHTGRGPTHRAFSLPYDTYGGPPGDTRVPFDSVADAVGAATVRVIDFHGRVDATGADVETHEAHVVDLDGDANEVEARFSRANRKALRQAESRGVSVARDNTAAGMETFYRLYQTTASGHGDVPMPESFYRAVHKHLTPRDMARVHVATREGEVIAAHLTLRTGREAVAWAIGYDESHLDARATNALVAAAIRDEVESGAERFNLGTSPAETEGVTRFKESFGARSVTYRIYSRLGAVYKAGRLARGIWHAIRR